MGLSSSNLPPASDGKTASQSGKRGGRAGSRLPRIGQLEPTSGKPSKRHLPTGVRPAAVFVLAAAAGVLLSEVLAWILGAIALVVLALDVAGTRQLQEYVPALGRLPWVRDHELERQPAIRRGTQSALPPAEAADDPGDELVRALRGEQRAGDGLAGEAQTLEPIGNMERVDDLIRRSDAFEGRVADILAGTTRLDPKWRDAWLRGPEGHSYDVRPISREGLDAMARMIGWRVRLIENMIRTLEGAPALRRALTSLIGRGADLQAEAELTGHGAESTLDRRSAAEIAAEQEAFRRRESEWMSEVEEVLADHEGYLRRFAEASDIPSTGIFAVSQRMKARVAALREIRDELRESTAPAEADRAPQDVQDLRRVVGRLLAELETARAHIAEAIASGTYWSDGIATEQWEKGGEDLAAYGAAEAHAAARAAYSRITVLDDRARDTWSAMVAHYEYDAPPGMRPTTAGNEDALREALEAIKTAESALSAALR